MGREQCRKGMANWRLVALVGLLLLPLPLLTDACREEQVRGCGQCPSCSRRPTNWPYSALDVPLCYIPHGVLLPPLTDVRQLPGGSYLLLLEMPGVESGGVKVELFPGSILSVKGLAQEPHQPRYLPLRGPHKKLFARNFLLPPHVDPAGIQYRLHQGLLQLELPSFPGPWSSMASSNLDSPQQPPPVEWLPYIPSAKEVDKAVPAEGLEGYRVECSADESCEMVATPLADVLLEGEESYVIVWEMPGVESAEVQVECRDSARDCHVSAVGKVEDGALLEDRLVRAERGGVRSKFFSGGVFFPPGHIASPLNFTATGEVRHGLLRVKLPRQQANPLVHQA